MSTFSGFSEEDLRRIKSGASRPNNALPEPPPFKTASFGHAKNKHFQLKNITLRKQLSEDAIDESQFEKCRLSLKSPRNMTNNNNEMLSHNTQEIMSSHTDQNNTSSHDKHEDVTVIEPIEDGSPDSDSSEETVIEEVSPKDIIRKDSSDVTPDIVRGVDLTEDELAAHRAKLEELQLKQRLMEEQNKKRKEMLSKALADRTRQTEEEVMKLEKIKKELQVLDGQFSQDVNVLRKKIDQACLTYAEAEKNYLKVEK